jgi:hypothetical protein
MKRMLVLRFLLAVGLITTVIVITQLIDVKILLQLFGICMFVFVPIIAGGYFIYQRFGDKPAVGAVLYIALLSLGCATMYLVGFLSDARFQAIGSVAKVRLSIGIGLGVLLFTGVVTYLFVSIFKNTNKPDS